MPDPRIPSHILDFHSCSSRPDQPRNKRYSIRVEMFTRDRTQCSVRDGSGVVGPIRSLGASSVDGVVDSPRIPSCTCRRVCRPERSQAAEHKYRQTAYKDRCPRRTGKSRVPDFGPTARLSTPPGPSPSPGETRSIRVRRPATWDRYTQPPKLRPHSPLRTRRAGLPPEQTGDQPPPPSRDPRLPHPFGSLPRLLALAPARRPIQGCLRRSTPL